MNEELDSQLSAMFDDELAPGECELLARRLSRDEQLKARWGRYAVVGAAIRSERGVRLNAPLAGRVSAVILTEAALAPSHGVRRAGVRWWQPLTGVAVAVGVAVISVLWLRAQAPLAGGPLGAHLTGATASAPSAPVVPAVAAGVPESYVVPRAPAVRAMVPSTELANYVVAHSVFSSPVPRRNLLSAFMTSESGRAADEPPDEPEGNVR
jgi:sigma-E factor negative regulatory protein RseA